MKLLFLYGPPAVGKLTLAKILEQKTKYKLLHNHLIVNPIAQIFPFENSANHLLVREFRIRILEEAARSNINLIATFGIAGNNPFEHISDLINKIEDQNGKILLIHLTANKKTLLNRVEDQFRKEHGKNLSKEKLKEILEHDKESFDKYPTRNHLTINTAELTPQDAVKNIIDYYKLNA